jgi:hypothetical protein
MLTFAVYLRSGYNNLYKYAYMELKDKVERVTGDSADSASLEHSRPEDFKQKLELTREAVYSLVGEGNELFTKGLAESRNHRGSERPTPVVRLELPSGKLVSLEFDLDGFCVFGEAGEIKEMQGVVDAGGKLKVLDANPYRVVSVPDENFENTQKLREKITAFLRPLLGLTKKMDISSVFMNATNSNEILLLAREQLSKDISAIESGKRTWALKSSDQAKEASALIEEIDRELGSKK